MSQLSVITPTEERPERLLRLYQALRAQEVSDWEWLIYDCSLKPCSEIKQYGDPRIRYIHEIDRKTIGMRRNLLVQEAKSDLIVHFDDDDYYAPEYLSVAKKALQGADFYHIHSWFAYHEGSRQFFYWDSQIPTKRRMAINPINGACIRELDFSDETAQKMIATGYGFSFAYRKQLALDYPFMDVDLKEDEAFFNACSGGRVFSHADREGIVLKVIHDTNVSCIFPQYMIPRFLVKTTHPHLIAYELALSKNGKL